MIYNHTSLTLAEVEASCGPGDYAALSRELLRLAAGCKVVRR